MIWCLWIWCLFYTNEFSLLSVCSFYFLYFLVRKTKRTGPIPQKSGSLLFYMCRLWTDDDFSNHRFLWTMSNGLVCSFGLTPAVSLERHECRWIFRLLHPFACVFIHVEQCIHGIFIRVRVLVRCPPHRWYRLMHYAQHSYKRTKPCLVVGAEIDKTAQAGMPWSMERRCVENAPRPICFFRRGLSGLACGKGCLHEWTLCKRVGQSETVRLVSFSWIRLEKVEKKQFTVIQNWCTDEMLPNWFIMVYAAFFHSLLTSHKRVCPFLSLAHSCAFECSCVLLIVGVCRSVRRWRWWFRAFES